jgi:hypothetical protein
MKTYWGVEVELHAFLASALDGGEWSVSRPGRFTPRERDPGTHWRGGWVGPRVVLDTVVKRKIPSLRQESNPRTPIIQSVAQRYTDWAITALIIIRVAKLISMTMEGSTARMLPSYKVQSHIFPSTAPADMSQGTVHALSTSGIFPETFCPTLAGWNFMLGLINRVTGVSGWISFQRSILVV